MSDPRNVAHDKRVSQEKKHGGDQHAASTVTAQPGKKPATKETHDSTSAVIAADQDTASGAAAPNETASSKPDAALEGSLVVLAKLKDLEFHSRAHLERLAELTLTIEDELKQKELVVPFGEVYSAQNAVQTKLTSLIEAYKAECDSMQG